VQVTSSQLISVIHNLILSFVINISVDSFPKMALTLTFFSENFIYISCSVHKSCVIVFDVHDILFNLIVSGLWKYNLHMLSILICVGSRFLDIYLKGRFFVKLDIGC
jgi:hypothetical protein